ncbi:unnamed protein product [Rotaria magnacalcarata]|uniref:Uncharacterized protein n=1 Tax=Rotaria magnacalcarata TaxID=392030 RepID=A0A816PY96_9BILA|nr:unnamed protein product [Rotaria magnacalcarata]
MILEVILMIIFLYVLYTQHRMHDGRGAQEPQTTSLPNSGAEFKSVQARFLDSWPDDLWSEVRIEAIHKINNAFLESRYQQFVHSNPKFANRECIGWHGTAAKCQNGQCKSSLCSLCQIIRNGFRRECARKDTSSYQCWGEASYFATQGFVCHTYNGASQSQMNNGTITRCTIMAKINCGNAFDQEKYLRLYEKHIGGTSADGSVPTLLNTLRHDTVTFNRNYYIAPTDYILSYNNAAAVPVYIVVYSVTSKAVQIRTTSGQYCSFHNEYHICSTGCDGHYGQECLGSYRCHGSRNYNGDPRKRHSNRLIDLTSKFIVELTADDAP